MDIRGFFKPKTAKPPNSLATACTSGTPGPRDAPAEAKGSPGGTAPRSRGAQESCQDPGRAAAASASGTGTNANAVPPPTSFRSGSGEATIGPPVAQTPAGPGGVGGQGGAGAGGPPADLGENKDSGPCQPMLPEYPKSIFGK